jgi:molybdenum cofactor cytidylyltransferase
MPSNVAIIVLAAGGSTRLGSPKQLLSFNGTTLIRRVLTAALESETALTVAVLGAQAADVHEEIPRGVQTIYNPFWSDGIHHSIHCGMEYVLTRPSRFDAVVLSNCDQPYIETSVFNALIRTYDGECGRIVASSYGGTLGTPVLFDAQYFKALQETQEGGAKFLIEQYREAVISVPFPNGEIDIDTPADYEKLIPQETFAVHPV